MPENEEGELKNSGTDKPRKFKIGKKKIIILACIVLVFLSIIMILGITKNSIQNSQNSVPTITNGVSRAKDSGNQQKEFNPLVNQREVDKVEDALRKKLESQGVTISPKLKYEFKYKLDPALQGIKSSMLIKAIFAADNCNIDLAPANLPVYTLKDHLNIEDAKQIAKEFDITSEPSGSIPSIDGNTFSYYFSDAVASQFLEVTEASGVVYWHRVVKEDAQSDVGAANAQAIAQEELGKHNLSENTVMKSSAVDPTSNYYLIHFEKNYNNYVMTDKSSILTLGASTSVCSVEASKSINFIETGITKNGFFQKLNNKTRKVLSSHMVKRATLEEALNEYKDNPPVEPIVVGGSATSGDVTIDEAVLVWYDYGELIPQTAYIPMYLTSGKASSGARVFTLFPAVTLTDLNNTGNPELSSESRDTLQLYTFNPPVAKSPPPPQNPMSGTPYPSIPGMTSSSVCTSTTGSFAGLSGSGGGSCSTGMPLGMPGSPLGGCFGGNVDYNTKCTDSTGLQVCFTMVSLKTDNSGRNDPWGVCKNGCQVKSGSINLSSGANPCAEFLKQQGIDASGTFTPPAFNYKGGPVQCQVQGCPC